MPRRPLLSRFRSQKPNGHYGIRSTQPTVLLTQQAPVRRGPRASATSLVTVSLAESEADAFLPNGVCVSPVHTRRVPET